MQRDMSDLNAICLSYIAGVISVGPLIEYDCKMHGHAEINQYEILILFVVTKSTWVSRNIILNYTRVTHTMPCVQYRYKRKRVIIHMIIITERLRHNIDILVTWVAVMCC